MANINKWLADCSFEEDYNRWQRIEHDIDSLLDNHQLKQQHILRPKNNNNDDDGYEVISPNKYFESSTFFQLLTPNTRYAMTLSDKDFFSWRLRDWAEKQRAHTKRQINQDRQERAFDHVEMSYTKKYQG